MYAGVDHLVSVVPALLAPSRTSLLVLLPHPLTNLHAPKPPVLSRKNLPIAPVNAF